MVWLCCDLPVVLDRPACFVGLVVVDVDVDVVPMESLAEIKFHGRFH